MYGHDDNDCDVEHAAAGDDNDNHVIDDNDEHEREAHHQQLGDTAAADGQVFLTGPVLAPSAEVRDLEFRLG